MGVKKWKAYAEAVEQDCEDMARRCKQAEAERDEARAENEQCAKDYREECDKRDAAEASLAKAVEGLRELGHMPIVPYQRTPDYAIAIHNRAHSILSDLEGGKGE